MWRPVSKKAATQNQTRSMLKIFIGKKLNDCIMSQDLKKTCDSVKVVGVWKWLNLTSHQIRVCNRVQAGP